MKKPADLCWPAGWFESVVLGYSTHGRRDTADLPGRLTRFRSDLQGMGVIRVADSIGTDMDRVNVNVSVTVSRQSVVGAQAPSPVRPVNRGTTRLRGARPPQQTHVTVFRGIPSTRNTPALDPVLNHDGRPPTVHTGRNAPTSLGWRSGCGFGGSSRCCWRSGSQAAPSQRPGRRGAALGVEDGDC
jgi:hypothetical protein